ncbi:hypothetical protein J4T85_014015 [Sinorhizobium medicae]|nr:hypothetical protein [Sinorhizobium medicae]MBO1959517.1 hypothetical protein [Sinorhizobium medicae]WQP37541.1 hypothetical protein U8C38_16530 [Sinorhizobium medicae]
MSLTTAFIAELIRAANGADRLTYYQISRLLDRSVHTIRDMRRQTGIAGSHRARGVVIDLQVASARARTYLRRRPETSCSTADIIRTLKILLDGKE